MAPSTRERYLSKGKITGYVATDVDNYLTAKRRPITSLSLSLSLCVPIILPVQRCFGD